MSKKGIIISIIVIVFLSIGATIGIVMNEKSQYDAKAKGVNDNITKVKADTKKLKSEKDTAGFLPSDVTKYFLNEAKAEAFEKAKLYVSKDKQSQDIKTWLALSKPLNTLSVQEVTYEITDETAKVKATIAFDGEEQIKVVKIIDLVKENSAWKIVEIGEEKTDEQIDAETTDTPDASTESTEAENAI